jgi:hypothetical protein
MLTTEIGQQIAQLINDRESAEIMIDAAIHAQPFNNENCQRWRAHRNAATAALRTLGIPVTN